MRSTLLDTVGVLLERTYAMRSGLRALGPFVIGDRGFERLYSGRAIVRSVGGADGSGAQTLIRQTESGLAACVYFPDAMIRLLEAHPPQHGLNARNFDAFATFVEEIDHLLVIAERAGGSRQVSLLELELHANVSKYLVLSRYLAGSGRPLESGERAWLRHRLFEHGQYDAEDPAVCERYRRAAAWAARFLARLAEIEPARRLSLLRRFHAAAAHEKVWLIEHGSA